VALLFLNLYATICCNSIIYTCGLDILLQYSLPYEVNHYGNIFGVNIVKVVRTIAIYCFVLSGKARDCGLIS
jgi:hypothetical protein